MSTPIKNPTQWRPTNGRGSVMLVGNLPLVDNVSKLPIVENVTKKPIVTTPTITLPKNSTTWTQVG